MTTPNTLWMETAPRFQAGPSERSVTVADRLAMSYVRCEYRQLRSEGIREDVARLAAIGWATSQFGPTSRDVRR